MLGIPGLQAVHRSMAAVACADLRRGVEEMRARHAAAEVADTEEAEPANEPAEPADSRPEAETPAAAPAATPRAAAALAAAVAPSTSELPVAAARGVGATLAAFSAPAVASDGDVDTANALSVAAAANRLPAVLANPTAHWCGGGVVVPCRILNDWQLISSFFLPPSSYSFS